MANIIKIKSICKTFSTQDAATTLLLMLCISHLDYANAVLYNIPEKTSHKYQTIQNICTKIALNKSKYSSSTKALKTLHWLPVHQQIQYKILTLMFKCIHNSAPVYIQELVTIKQNARENMRSNNKGTLLKVPKVKREFFTARAFSFSGPTLWNRLPQHIRGLKLLDQFKTRLKTHLYTKPFPT